MARTCVIQCNLKTSRLERTAFPLKRAGCSVQAEYAGNEDAGYVMACGMNAPTDVKGTEYIQQAYEMGKSI